MPEISRFYGIIITMYYLDHPPPHFHVRYNESRAVMRLADLAILEGQLPGRVSAMVREWAKIHAAELEENWRKAESHKPLSKIQPLD